jgi:hypothetical protein
VGGQEEFLTVVDWGTVGTNMSAMTPLISQFAKRFADDGSMDPEVVGKINSYNGPLVTAALAAGQKGQLEPNVAFTHPAFMVNAIAATLEAAKVPLSEAQGASLGEVAGRYTTELSRLPAATEPDRWALARLADESELRERFFVDAFRLLSAEQLAALTPPYAKDRLQMDIFSAPDVAPHAQCSRGRRPRRPLRDVHDAGVAGAADKPVPRGGPRVGGRPAERLVRRRARPARRQGLRKVGRVTRPRAAP